MVDPAPPDPAVPEGEQINPVVADPIVPGAVDTDSLGVYEADLEASEKKTKVRSVVFRVVLIIGALVVSGWILLSTFEDLDFDAVVEAIGSLEDADLISLIAMWVIWIGSQGLLTGSLLPGLPVRRGVVAYLGPAGVTSIVPGPSDLPFRLKMFIAWGRSPTDATLAVAAGSVFSIGIKLVLPVVAAIGLLVSGAPIEGTLKTVVVVAVLLGVGVLAVAAIVASEKRTAKLGRIIAPVHGFVLRLLRKPDPPDLAETLTAARAESIVRLRDRWMIGTWATVSTAATRFALLLMAIRFTGTPDERDQLAGGLRGLRHRPRPDHLADHGRRRRRQRGCIHRIADRRSRLPVRQPDHRRCPRLPGPDVGPHHPDRTGDTRPVAVVDEAQSRRRRRLGPVVTPHRRGSACCPTDLTS